MTEPSYSDCLHHLEEELEQLDQLLLEAVERFQPPDRPPELEQFKGLVLSVEEISQLLRGGAQEHGTPPNRRETLPRSRINERIEATRQEGTYLPLVHLHQILQATEFEKQCLVLALAPEIDRKYEKVFAFLQDDVTCKNPTVGLALDLFCQSRRQRLLNLASFDPNMSLRRYRILHLRENRPEGASPLLSRLLKLDDRIVRFLLGGASIDESISEAAELTMAAEELADDGCLDVLRQLTQLLDSHFDAPEPASLTIHLYGRYGSGKRTLAKLACRHLDLPLLLVDLRKMAALSDYPEAVWHASREAMLQPAALGFEHFGELIDERQAEPGRLIQLLHGIEIFSRLTFLLGESPWKPIGLLPRQQFVSLECPTPKSGARLRLWRTKLGGDGANLDEESLKELAGKFDFTPGQIGDALRAARALRALEDPHGVPLDSDSLHRACRAQANPKLSTLARKIEPAFRWNDIVLPDNQLNQLKEITSHVRHATVVMDDWGFGAKFPLGRGVTGLFAGGSGTGKTMAAEILAADLALDLYKIDLSGVVSKYIGETEKNLNQIFREAQESNAILFFDEADALFGKRSEVKDSHDRYANIEIAYLLQRMEEYKGIVILATNLKRNMDEAFVRRMRFIVDFPFPDAAERERIWGKIFPRRAALAEDVDFRFLARKLKVSGGNIKNISLRAAYMAVAGGVAQIDMACLVEASKKELEKVGKIYSEEEFKPRSKAGSSPLLVQEAGV